MDEVEEEWRDIEGYEGMYQVSNLGNVRSLDRTIASSGRLIKRKGMLLSAKPNKRGYCGLTIHKNGVGEKFFVHRLVALTFIANPECKLTVNHINGIKHDNRVDNLEWNTIEENNQHAIDSGLNEKKVSDKDVLEIKRLYSETRIPISEIAKKFGLSVSQVSRLCLGTRRRGLGDIAIREHRACDKIDKKIAEKIVDDLNNGASANSLSHKYDVSVGTIYAIMNGKVWSIDKNSVDVKRKTHKLSVGDVIDIKKQIKCGATVSDLAKKFDVTVSTIRHIKRGLTWKNVKIE